MRYDYHYGKKNEKKKKKRRQPVYGDLSMKATKAFGLTEKIERASLRRKEAAARPSKSPKPKPPKKGFFRSIWL
jgi:hypothetical protein